VTYTIGFQAASDARGNAVIAMAAASAQIKDPDYANNADAITVKLGPSIGIIGSAGRSDAASANPFALGGRLVARLKHRSLARRFSTPHDQR
jgi:hypothetical protein